MNWQRIVFFVVMYFCTYINRTQKWRFIQDHKRMNNYSGASHNTYGMAVKSIINLTSIMINDINQRPVLYFTTSCLCFDAYSMYRTRTDLQECAKERSDIFYDEFIFFYLPRECDECIHVVCTDNSAANWYTYSYYSACNFCTVINWFNAMLMPRQTSLCKSLVIRSLWRSKKYVSS